VEFVSMPNPMEKADIIAKAFEFYAFYLVLI
jgi:hypothetical protein